MMTIVLSSVLSAVVCLGIYILVTKYVTKKTIKAPVSYTHLTLPTT